MSPRSLHRIVLALALSCCAQQCLAGETPATQPPAVAYWPFDGDLGDATGRGNDAYVAAPQFAEGQRGSALKLGGVATAAPDGVDLRLAPGLRLDCWVKLAELPPGGQEILVKRNEYLLRVNPASEGGQFSFFVYLDGWEPRVQSKVVPQVGTWYHVAAGWDGKVLSLEANGDRAQGERAGQPAATDEPLCFGPGVGILDEVRIDNPNAKSSGVAYWPFDGDLRDQSGHGHDGVAEGAKFSPGRVEQALGGGEPVVVANSPDLQLAPGIRLDCLVYFDKVPPGIQNLVRKEGEYMLRVNPPNEGSNFSFFVNLSGWEPRVQIKRPVQAGVWYRVIARWDGSALTLDVNGEKSRLVRGGLPHVTDNPVTIGGPDLRIDELRLENPRLPVVQVRELSQEHTLLRVGVRETLTALVQNLGAEAGEVSAGLTLPPEVRCLGDAVQPLGTLTTGDTKTIQWQVQADRESAGVAEVRLTCQGAPPVTSRRRLAFFPSDDAPAAVAVRMRPPHRAGATTYYVDSLLGNNASAGTSPDAPWRDFTNVNGKTLGPGEKLLIKRGSVINQELSVSARGTADNWAQIGAYGTGPRPTIRRNWDIDDRCALVRNPDYLHISSLVVCYAGKGLVVHYQQGRHTGLLIEDCIAHHIEGLYRPNANGIPEWRDRNGAEREGLHRSPGRSAGIALGGVWSKDAVIRDCEVFQNSWGYYFANGEGLIVDRVYCHDNYVLNTSPHPALVGVRRSYLQNSIFDAPGFHASAGTMGIMVVDPQGLIIRNCTFRNQPDSGSYDEGGIDFEAAGNGCLIDHCTFQNNAGPAIEVLGLKGPQARNLEIADTRFLANNTARKHGPAEVYIWGKSPNAEVCCSTGSIHDNGYVTLPGVEFFVNEAPKTTQWTLQNNTVYATTAELDKGMPFNGPPEVDAGPDVRTDKPTVRLAGTVRDDGRTAKPLTVRWEVLEGAGTVTFRDPASPQTEADFSPPGDYLLRLVADDGELWLSDLVAVHVLPPGVSVAAAWEFNKPLDKEGWTEVNTGTQLREWTHPLWSAWSTISHPVKYVAGGYYLVAVENSPDAHLLSGDNLSVDLIGRKTIKLRFQNHTPATRMRFRFTTEADPAWQDANSKTFDVTPNDNGPHDYTVDMSTVPGWTGRLKQLRLDLATGAELSGTCRLDYLWISN